MEVYRHASNHSTGLRLDARNVRGFGILGNARGDDSAGRARVHRQSRRGVLTMARAFFEDASGAAVQRTL